MTILKTGNFEMSDRPWKSSATPKTQLHIHQMPSEHALYFTPQELATLYDIIADYMAEMEDNAEEMITPEHRAVEQKVIDAHAEHCVEEYRLTPALRAYMNQYGTEQGIADAAANDPRWQGFRDAYNLVNV